MPLNPTAQDKSGIVLANFDGTADAENYPSGNKPVPSGDATLLFVEDFESTLKEGGQLQNGCEIVTNQPFSGTRCARSNLKGSANDPYIASPANNGTYFYGGDALLVSTAPEVYTIRIHYRVDDATWEGSGGFVQSSPSEMVAKGGWYGPKNWSVQKGFYTVLWGGTGGSIRFGDNNTNDARGDAGWENETWAEGRTIFYLSTGTNWGAGTGWFVVDMVIDTSHPDYNQVTLKVDGVTATAGYAPDGIMRVPKTWYVEEFDTIYTNTDAVDLSTDRTETACGVQVDNIEIYSGVPS